MEVVVVSNGDQELARAVTPHLGIKFENAVGSHLIYKRVNGKRVSTGVNHAYEIFDKEWNSKPQPGKSLSFHYWLNTNKWRWGWKNIDLHRVVVAGADGDSASSDGGMMTLLPPGSALGNFMVDTPTEPGRLKKRPFPRKIRLDQRRVHHLGPRPGRSRSLDRQRLRLLQHWIPLVTKNNIVATKHVSPATLTAKMQASPRVSDGEK